MGAFKPSAAQHPRWIALATAIALYAAPAQAQTPPRWFFIPAQPLSSALLELSRQFDVLIIVSPDLTRGKQAPSLRATLPAGMALGALLRGSGLRAVRNPSGGYRIERDLMEPTTAPEKRGFIGRASPARLVPKSSTPPTETPSPISEVIVTAEKRSERLQDVPVPVTALDPDTILTQNQTRLQDFFLRVPGLSLNAQGDGTTNIVLRGINTGVFGNPTVGVLIDDIPFGGSTAISGGQILHPDLDPTNLSQIEVLRGPQGTLYGASTLGGLINYVTRDPAMARFSGRLQASVEGADSGGAGAGLSAAVDIPVVDGVAVRAGGFVRRSPGYVDDVASRRNNVNSVDATGGDLVLLWKPFPIITIRLGALYQQVQAYSGSYVETDYDGRQLYGDLKEAFLPGSGANRTASQLYSSRIDLSLRGLHLTSLTGYGINGYREAGDTSTFYSASPYNLPASELVNRFGLNKISQEFRLSSSLAKLDWLVGSFYTHESAPVDQQVDSVQAGTGKFQGIALDTRFPSTFQEIAIFFDGRYDVTSAINVQAGARYSANRQIYSEFDTGPQGDIAPGKPFTDFQKASSRSVTFLLEPQYRLNPQMMAYLRLASGYRPGGLSPDATLKNFQDTFKADSTQNTELGFKGVALDDSLTFDVSAYYIDWKSIQIRLIDPISQFSYVRNGGSALSSGVEGSVTYRTRFGLKIATNTSYGVAELSTDQPVGLDAKDGQSLPYTPRVSGSLSADESFPASPRLEANIGATMSYTDRRSGNFPTSVPEVRAVLPSYVNLDLRAGLKSGRWVLSIYVRNVADSRGVLSSRAFASTALRSSPYITNFTQPRTTGLYLSRSF